MYIIRNIVFKFKSVFDVSTFIDFSTYDSIKNYAKNLKNV